MGEKRNQMIKEYLNEPLKIGDKVLVNKGKLLNTSLYSDKNAYGVITGFENGKVRIKYEYSETLINSSDIIEKDTDSIGINPFVNDWKRKLRSLQYDIDGIMFHCGLMDETLKERYEINGIRIKSINFNPYIFDKDGNKKYYQRDFVWSLKDKQMLIQSIYNEINCGDIILRKHSWEHIEKLAKNGETELYFNDVVDGKQRLNCLYEFINDKIPDESGNYFSDLSKYSQRKFLSRQVINFKELSEDATDEDTIKTFLMENFAGVQCSQEHIDYVKTIYNSLCLK